MSNKDTNCSLLSDENLASQEVQAEIIEIVENGSKVGRNLVEKIINSRIENSWLTSLKGFIYSEGLHVEADLGKAKSYYEKAALSDESNAICWLGYFFENGVGGEVDHKKAFEFYKRAARLGDMIAQYNVAQYYNEGGPVELDKKKAVEWWLVAARNGHPQAQCNLGVAYENGKSFGVKQRNPRSALKWYRLAMENKDKLGRENYMRLKRQVSWPTRKLNGSGAKTKIEPDAGSGSQRE